MTPNLFTLTRSTVMLASVLLGAVAPLGATAAHAEMLGEDAATCLAGTGPAVQVNVVGLKDRAGEVWLELYPATETDFLQSEESLRAEGKAFRRTRAKSPPSAAVSMCIRVPRPGRYAVLFRHNRTGRDKFSVFSDGIGLPTNRVIGRNRPTVGQATIEVGSGVAVTTIRVQYLRGFGGFSPLRS